MVGFYRIKTNRTSKVGRILLPADRQQASLFPESEGKTERKEKEKKKARTKEVRKTKGQRKKKKGREEGGRKDFTAREFL